MPESQASIGARSARTAGSHDPASVAPQSRLRRAPAAPRRILVGVDPERVAAQPRPPRGSSRIRIGPESIHVWVEDQVGRVCGGQSAPRQPRQAMPCQARASRVTTPARRPHATEEAEASADAKESEASRSAGRAACAVPRRRGSSQARESDEQGQSRLTRPSRSASPPAVPLCENGADPRSPAGSCMTGHRSGSGRPDRPCGPARCRL